MFPLELPVKTDEDRSQIWSCDSGTLHCSWALAGPGVIIWREYHYYQHNHIDEMSFL